MALPGGVPCLVCGAIHATGIACNNYGAPTQAVNYGPAFTFDHWHSLITERDSLRAQIDAAIARAEKAEKERDASIGMQRPAEPPRYFNSRGEEVEHPVVLDARLDELRKVVALLLVKP